MSEWINVQMNEQSLLYL